MIPARKHPAFNFALRRWLALVLRRRFHSVRLAGGEHLRALASASRESAPPVVGCVNHTNWWDGFLLYVLSHRCLPHDIYLAMEEKNLRRYRFFTWMGVFGLDLSDRRSVLPGLRYAVKLLRGETPADGIRRNTASARLVWMFVQGALVSPRLPVAVKPGATFLARHAGAALLPVVLRYDWLIESRATIFVHVGETLPATTEPEKLAARLDELLAQTDDAIEHREFSAWEELLPPRMSMNKRWDYFLHLFSGRREKFDSQNG